MSYITIASDASCGARGEGTGLAYYIRDEYGTTAKAWAINMKLSPIEAEREAVLAALAIVSEREYPEGTTLIYYCDNMGVVQSINDNFARKPAPTTQSFMDKVKHLTSHIDEVVGLYVETHGDSGKLKRHYMNRWCDHNARAMRRHNKYHEDYKEIK